MPDAVDAGHFRIGNAIAPTPRGKPMILASGICRRTPSTIFCVGWMHQRSNCSGPSTPAQVSKICTHSAPALSCPTRYSIEPCTSRSISRPKLCRIAIGKQPRRRLVRRRLARHHVGRHRPRRAAKSDQRGLAVERRLDPRHRLIDRRQHLAVDAFAQVRQRRGIGQRLELRPFADLKFDLAAERQRDHQNIGKQDRGIETETPHRLQGHFRRQFGIKAEIEKAAGFLTHRTIFRQIPAGLPHHPDRRNRFACALPAREAAALSPHSQFGRASSIKTLIRLFVVFIRRLIGLMTRDQQSVHRLARVNSESSAIQPIGYPQQQRRFYWAFAGLSPAVPRPPSTYLHRRPIGTPGIVPRPAMWMEMTHPTSVGLREG